MQGISFLKICLSCNSPIEADTWKCSKCQSEPVSQDGFIKFAPDIDDGFEARFFEFLAAHEDGHFWFETRNDILVWAFQKFFSSPQNFFEIGCGTGFVLNRFQHTFPNLHLTGSDLFVEGVRVASKRVPSADLFQMDARNIPFQEEFDVIGAFDVLEHIKEDEEALKKMFNATKVGGGIMLTVPQHQFLWSHVDEYGHHERRYSRSELVTKVKNAGFEVSYVNSFMTLTLPLMFLARLKSQKVEDYDASSEVVLNPIINGTLRQLLKLERLFLRTRFPMLLGGSLLLIAKRPEKKG